MEAIRRLKLAHDAAAPFLSRRLSLAERPSSWRFGGLFQALRAEIDSMPDSVRVPPPPHSGGVGDFTVVYRWDGEDAGSVGKDLLLRRRWRSRGGGDAREEEEEIAVSAVLGPVRSIGMDVVPGNVFMKVGVKKKGVRSVVVFDCEVVEDGGRSDFGVRRVSCVPPGSAPDGSVCRRQVKSNPNDALQLAFKKYLVVRGINADLTDYLLLNMRETEDRQYVAWLMKYLQILESMK